MLYFCYVEGILRLFPTVSAREGPRRSSFPRRPNSAAVKEIAGSLMEMPDSDGDFRTLYDFFFDMLTLYFLRIQTLARRPEGKARVKRRILVPIKRTSGLRKHSKTLQSRLWFVISHYLIQIGRIQVIDDERRDIITPWKRVIRVLEFVLHSNSKQIVIHSFYRIVLDPLVKLIPRKSVSQTVLPSSLSHDASFSALRRSHSA